MAMVGFAVITGYMIFAASKARTERWEQILCANYRPSLVWLAVKGIQSIQADGAIDAQEILDNTVFRNIVLSLAVTYGLYVVSSLLAFDPWHMGESIRRARPV